MEFQGQVHVLEQPNAGPGKRGESEATGIILVRKTRLAVEFLTRWLEACEVAPLCSVQKCLIANELVPHHRPEFISCRHRRTTMK